MALTECPHCKAGHVCHAAPGQPHYPLSRLEDEIGESHRQLIHAIRVREDAPRGSSGGVLRTTLFEMLTRLEALIEAHAVTSGAISYPSHPLLSDIRKHARDQFGMDLAATAERARTAGRRGNAQART